jgi:hypothetical protein
VEELELSNYNDLLEQMEKRVLSRPSGRPPKDAEKIKKQEIEFRNRIKKYDKEKGATKKSHFNNLTNRMDLVSGFSKNLAYTLKQLSIFTKQTVKAIPDRVNAVNLGDVSRFKLPASAMIDFRTISIFAGVTLYKGALGGADDSGVAWYIYHATPPH